jgi:hypothetical protein
MHRPGLEPLHTAFGVSLALWAALMLADELVLVYEVEAPPMRIFMAQLVSFLVLHLVPDGRSPVGCELLPHPLGRGQQGPVVMPPANHLGSHGQAMRAGDHGQRDGWDMHGGPYGT